MVSKRHITDPIWTQKSHPQFEPQMVMSLAVQVCQWGGHSDLRQLRCYGRRDSRAALAKDSKCRAPFKMVLAYKIMGLVIMSSQLIGLVITSQLMGLVITSSTQSRSFIFQTAFPLLSLPISQAILIRAYIHSKTEVVQGTQISTTYNTGPKVQVNWDEEQEA